MSKSVRIPQWMKYVLLVAGIYNLLFGLWAILFPNTFFSWSGMALPQYPELWQCIGMIVGVYGIGYIIASTNPLRHWPIVLVGLLGKIFGPIGFLKAWLIDGTFTPMAGGMILFNDLIWWIPFGLILYKVYRKDYDTDDSLVHLFSSDEMYSLDMFETSEGLTLDEMSNRWPTMLIFLRHFGCTFCREALQDLASCKEKIEVLGTRVVLVHMLEEDCASRELERFGLTDIAHISDPESILYKKFKLRRGTIGQLFGLKVWIRGIDAGLLKSNGVGRAKGDPFQMPGVFIIKDGKVVKKYVHQSAADRPDYQQMAACEV